MVWDGYTVHDAANVLRRYLNDLPEPVVPLDLYEKFREPLRGATRPAAGDADGPQFLDHFDMDAAIVRYQQLITELPPLNRQLLLYILDLLAVFAAKSDHNRMTSQNLAAIFQPGMLSHPAHAMAPEEYRLNQCVIIFLIENQDHFLIGMQGTAADEKTVAEVQQGTPVVKPPSTPTPRSGIVRSPSIASAGAENVAREGSIRRNKSTSSRRSMHSNGCPSPASPALVSTTPTSGLARSNTLPSKKSPALQSGRFASRNDTPAPLTPVVPPAPTVVSPPTAPQEAATRPEESALSLSTSTAPFGLQPGLQPGVVAPAARSQERLLEPLAPEPTTPSKERKLPILFQRIASSTSESDGRPTNKLRKKRLPGSANPSAHSSTASLPHSSAVSPNVEVVNPLEAIPSVPQAAGLVSVAPQPVAPQLVDDTLSELTPRASHAPPSAEPSQADEGSSDTVIAGPSSANPDSSHASTNGSNAHTSTLNPGAAHTDPPRPDSSAHADTLHPSSAQTALKTKKSPPTSLHSSFNEGSDLDQLDELPAPPAELAPPETPSEKEKKRRWRLSRKKDDPPPPAFPPVASPRLGAHPTASASGTSLNSSGRLGPSTTGGYGGGDMSDRTATTASTMTEAPPLTEVSSKESGPADAKKISTWIKNKYREHKEHVEHRRNKSPPPSQGERTVSLGSSLLSSASGRGKSLDLKRAEEERPPPLPTPQPTPLPTQTVQTQAQTQTQQTQTQQTQTQQDVRGQDVRGQEPKAQ